MSSWGRARNHTSNEVLIMKFETYKKICDSMGVHVGEVVWDENIKNILEQDKDKNSLINEKLLETYLQMEYSK